MESKSTHSGGVLRRMPPPVRYNPYAGKRDFGKKDKEIKEEVVRLGVDLSLYVAESMFILCDDIRNMLMFCFVLWRNAVRNRNRHSPVVERLVRVIHYVYSKDIKPKNGLYHDNGGNSVQWDLIRTTWTDFVDGIRDLDFLVLMLGGEGCCLEGSIKCRIGQVLQRLEEKLKVAKSVSESNGFAREALKTNVLEFLWKSVFDKEAKEATQTLKVINNEILSDLFLRLWNEAN